jgi:hypothetical protein
MKTLYKCIVLGIYLTLSAGCAQNNRVELGRLENGATVSFVRAAEGDWGIEITGGTALHLMQQKPSQIEVYNGDENVRQFAAGYKSVHKNKNTVLAKVKVTGGDKAAFNVEDRWNISGAVLSLSRKVSVTCSEDSAGFYSAIRLLTEPTVKWEDIDYFAPGLLYADPTYDGETSPGGTLYYKSRFFNIREDNMAAPLFGLSFHRGNWAAVLDLSPQGETTFEESNASASTPVIDENLKFGALGACEIPGNGVEFGFWLPGTTNEFAGGGFGARIESTPAQVVRRRYNPVRKGFSQSYQVGFRVGEGDSFLSMERDTWRWAWKSLDPAVIPVDLELVRHTLIDHLEDRVLTAGDMTGIPFLFDAVTGNPGSYRTRRPQRQVPSSTTRPPAAIPRMSEDLSPEETLALAKWAATVGVYLDPNADELFRWPKVVMGFVSKGIESADQLLLEGDRDPGPRGQKMRESGLKIIDTFIRKVPMAPPAGEGFSMWTGKPDCGSAGAGVVTLRGPSEGMRTLLDAYRREKSKGVEHPEWLTWCRQYADWLLKQQREDGSFPRSWHAGKGTVREVSGTSTYNPIPMFVKLSSVTGEKKYLEAAIRASEYVWDNFGNKGIFIGGATDNPNIVDKEAGMLSLNAFLSLYESTNDPLWLERAQAAGNYTETWIWIWNVPMPIGANDSTLHWKRGVPTIGLQGITARVSGGVDEYLAWAAPDYAKLYKYTNDEHYLDVARVLLHDTKAMTPLPGRTFDLLGPGWQQEHWSMGLRRGYGGHRAWLPWVSVNHLHGITGLEEFDQALYKQLAGGK